MLIGACDPMLCPIRVFSSSFPSRYMINVKQIAKFVVALGDKVAPTDIEEGMRVGVDRQKYQIQIPLPPKIDPTVSMMQVRPARSYHYRRTTLVPLCCPRTALVPPSCLLALHSRADRAPHLHRPPTHLCTTSLFCSVSMMPG